MHRPLRVSFETMSFLVAALTVAAARVPAADDGGQPASVLPHLNQLTDAERAAGWKLLFDGRTTTGWRNQPFPHAHVTPVGSTLWQQRHAPSVCFFVSS
jgi:hypothetical protein